ncbi:hypothetical protein IQ251_16095 [Saccharopolyspora sp. HNM0983]|uniref:Uncharacterized protein n=1 Tax=Saccharopolyspora montiporae TaxID=2781240 RepID=A0A929BDC7_9PSEU|nr:hypothetical protein [Saccharopolyspora sp. HNM0983]MBE9375973.1 hypothetical protein [Saccharopolyspora sp. HNM0983]
MAYQGNPSADESTGSEHGDAERFFVLPSETAERIRREESRRADDGGECDRK